MSNCKKQKPYKPDALTSIYKPIHCAATPEEVARQEQDELDNIAIQTLLETLAEVALAAARRR